MQRARAVEADTNPGVSLYVCLEWCADVGRGHHDVERCLACRDRGGARCRKTNLRSGLDVVLVQNFRTIDQDDDRLILKALLKFDM